MVIIMAKKNDKTIENNELLEIMKTTFSGNDIVNEYENKKDIETLKIILTEIWIKERLAHTTNLSNKQVHGITKLTILNKMFKSTLIDSYIYNIEVLKRSETKEPQNILNGLFNLANNLGDKNKDELSNIDRILGRKGR